jgi:diguanylate cyclase (GGDEF)-like protein
MQSHDPDPDLGRDGRTKRDTMIVVALTILAYVFGITTDFHERVIGFLQRYDEYEFDELLLTGSFLSLMLLIFAYRRTVDQKRQLIRHFEEESRIRAVALHDSLTGLPNRRHFAETIEKALAIPPRAGHAHAVMLLDLNGFKHINDLFGHPAGDEILIGFAERLKSDFGSECFIARLGGDEFAILTTDVPGAEGAARIARRIILAFEKPLSAAGSEHIVSTGIGIALSPQDGVHAPEIMRNADLALYRAKDTNGEVPCFFEAQMDDHVRNRMQMENDMRAAIVSGDLGPYYQPVVDLVSGRIVGFEALARWTHRKKGEIPPSLFIPIAEDSALIRDLTEAILRRACRDALAWPHDILLSINMSSVLLKERSIGLRILAILAKAGLPPRRLEIEVTEAALINDPALIESVFNQLRGAGVRIALQEFGAGRSTIHHLRHFRFDKIKIDYRYVQGIGSDPESDAIISAVLDLGGGLGMTVTAVGIDDISQRDVLLQGGCREGQGFLFGKAMPAVEAAKLVGAQLNRNTG